MDRAHRGILVAVLALAVLLVPACAAASDAEPTGEVPDEFEDRGQIWSMVLEYAFTGDSVSEIPTWDFDDGSEPVQAWSGTHRYEDEGTYYVKQTAKNNMGTVETYYKVQIMGYPTVTYDFNIEGVEDEVVQQTRANDVPASVPDVPQRDGYTFDGWFTADGEEFDPESDIVEEPIVLTARWTENTYTVTFEGQPGVVYTIKKVPFGEPVTAPSVPSKWGGNFLYWTLNGEEYDFDSPVNSDITLVAEFEDIVYTVQFDTGEGGSAVQNQFVAHGQKADRPEDPTRPGYRFDGWFVGDEEYDFDDIVTSDLVITAHWKEVWTTPAADEDDEGGDGADYVAIALIVVGIILAVAAIAVYSILGPFTFVIGLAGLIMLILGVLTLTGVF